MIFVLADQGFVVTRVDKGAMFMSACCNMNIGFL
jgi:hypothetical protein